MLPLSGTSAQVVSSVDGSAKQAHGYGGQSETAVEAMSHSGEKTLRIFRKIKSMVSTGKTLFENTQYGVDPAKLRQIHGFATTRGGHRMPPSCVGNTVETRKAIHEDLAVGIQSGAHQVFYGRIGESLNDHQSCAEGMSFPINISSMKKETNLIFKL